MHLFLNQVVQWDVKNQIKQTKQNKINQNICLNETFMLAPKAYYVKTNG